MKGSSAVWLNARLCVQPNLSSDTSRAEERMLRTYRKVINYLLQTYASNDVIAEANDALRRRGQPLAMSPTQYGEP